MNTKRAKASACEGDESYIYVTGSDFTIYRGRSAERYDTKTDTWQKLPPMKGARYWHGSIHVGHSLYVFCGQNIFFDPRIPRTKK